MISITTKKVKRIIKNIFAFIYKNKRWQKNKQDYERRNRLRIRQADLKSILRLLLDIYDF
jgi:hypothetical protein